MADPARATDDEGKSSEEDELEGGRMPFLEHLRELRVRVRNAAYAFIVAAGVCYYFREEIFDWLKEPLYRVWPVHKLGPPHLVFGGLTEPFWVGLSIALWAGIFVASPFIFHQLWKFIAPGLYKRERKITVMFSICSAVFFTAGALFCYYVVIERLYAFLISYGEKDQQPMLLMKDYLDLTRDMMLAFGAVFELPLLIYFLAMVGMVTHRGLWKFNRWFVVIAFIVGAILTPSPDVVSQVLMALPMIALYNVSILFAWRITIKREREEALQRAREDASD